jgi:hypothetical protein
MPPNPGLRRGLKKEWGLVARKSRLSFESCVQELYPLNCRVGRCESAAEEGVWGWDATGCHGKPVLAGRYPPPDLILAGCIQCSGIHTTRSRFIIKARSQRNPVQWNPPNSTPLRKQGVIAAKSSSVDSTELDPAS